MLQLSVVVPCYNVEKIIKETFQSLENQTSQDFETIFINDGSTDNTLQKLLDFSRNTKLNVKILSQKNGGVSVARNYGIEESKGQYITFLDADDIYHPEYVFYMLNMAKHYQDCIVYCKLSRNLKYVYRFVPTYGNIIMQTGEEAAFNLLHKMGDFGFYCYLYNRDIIERENLRFTVGTSFGEDREFIWKYFINFKKAVYINMPLYGYRLNENSVTRGHSSWRKTDSLASIIRTEQYLLEKKSKYFESYKDYMYARATWGVAKTFALDGNRILYNKFICEYDVKPCMKRLLRDDSKLVISASFIYIIHPFLFYLVIRLKRFI